VFFHRQIVNQTAFIVSRSNHRDQIRIYWHKDRTCLHWQSAWRTTSRNENDRHTRVNKNCKYNAPKNRKLNTKRVSLFGPPSNVYFSSLIWRLSLLLSFCVSPRGVARNLIWVGINGSRRQNNHIKNLRETDLGVYIPIYPRRYDPGLSPIVFCGQFSSVSSGAFSLAHVQCH